MYGELYLTFAIFKHSVHKYKTAMHLCSEVIISPHGIGIIRRNSTKSTGHVEGIWSVIIAKSEGEKLLRSPRFRFGDNTKMDLKEPLENDSGRCELRCCFISEV